VAVVDAIAERLRLRDGEKVVAAVAWSGCMQEYI
jgi:hypothetical protein